MADEVEVEAECRWAELGAMEPLPRPERPHYLKLDRVFAILDMSKSDVYKFVLPYLTLYRPTGKRGIRVREDDLYEFMDARAEAPKKQLPGS